MNKGPVFWIVTSGIVWFATGVFLLIFGVKLVVFSFLEGGPNCMLLSKVTSYVKNREQATFVLVAAGLLLGFIKGRFILSKTAARVVKRIYSLPPPIKMSQVYSVGYVGLIAGMILLGMSMRWFMVPWDIRGVIDIAVGSALMNGAMFYFRAVLVRAKKTE